MADQLEVQETRALSVESTTVTAWPFPSCAQFRRMLREGFQQVTVLGPVWGNVPPAMVLACGEPK